jgi:murein DD-endopeptidase MepM/ murein hydrolase activator NlpD
MPARRASSISIFLDRVFAPREIYVSWGDRFRYLRVTARTQKMAAGGAALVIIWSLLATAGTILDRRSLASKEIEIARQERAYDALRRDLKQAFQNRAKLERRVLARQAKLKVQVEALRAALEEEKADRLALWEQRNTLSLRMEDLKTRTSRSRETEREVMARLSERIEEGAAAVEKTIAMTGLNVDDLIAGAAGPDLGEVTYVPAGLGQGGPYIPADSFSAGIPPGSELAAPASRLGEQLDRWSRLHEVVRRLPLGLPLDQFRISSGYGKRRDPMSGRKARHPGIDFAAPGGTPIYATSPGIVVSAGRNGRYGYMVEIDHGYGIRTRYAHMRKILVEEGQEVGYRWKIGLVGRSGRSTGPHLHYEVRLQAQTRNPMKYILAGKYLFKD